MKVETAIIAFSAKGYSDQAKAEIPAWSDIILAVLSTGKDDLVQVDRELVAKVKRKTFGDVFGIELCIWLANIPVDFCTFMMPRNAVFYLEARYPL